MILETSHRFQVVYVGGNDILEDIHVLGDRRRLRLRGEGSWLCGAVFTNTAKQRAVYAYYQTCWKE